MAKNNKNSFIDNNSSSGRKSILYGIVGISMCLLLITAGCRLRRSPAPRLRSTVTSEAVDTQIPSPTLIPTFPFLPTTEPEQNIEIETNLYSHPNNLFSLQVPENWSPTQYDNGVDLKDPRSFSTIQVDVINTGYTLDPDSLSNFIEAEEKEIASGLANYIEINHQTIPQPQSRLITKQYTHQGIERTLATLYQQHGQAILILNVDVDQEVYPSYQELLNALIESIEVNLDEVSDLLIYSFDQAERYSNDYFSILKPPYWSQRQSLGEQTIVDTITSPDEQAVIQTIVYDDGESMSMYVAGNLVLSLLRENYSSGVTVLSDRLLKDGREQLIWRSNNENYRGMTAFETHGSAVFVLTVLWSDDSDHLYQTILETIMESYMVLDFDEG